MASRMSAYKTELNERYWAYQASQYPTWQHFFDHPRKPGLRPPVFRVRESWRNVLFAPDATKREIDRVLALVPDPERHKWFRSMNSSQALAQSILGNLAVRGFLDRLAEIPDDDGRPLFGDAAVSADNFAMEFKLDYLREPRPTSLDGYLEGETRVAIECKFTEPEVGTCSRPRLRPGSSNYGTEHCDGTYTLQRGRHARCSLAEIGVLYWQYIPELFKWKGDQDLCPCPVRLNYQLVRNILAAGANPDGEVSRTGGHVLLIYDERNPAFQSNVRGHRAFTETRNALCQPLMLRKCSWQRITRHMRQEDILPCLTEQLSRKYGL